MTQKINDVNFTIAADIAQCHDSNSLNLQWGTHEVALSVVLKNEHVRFTSGKTLRRHNVNLLVTVDIPSGNVHIAINLSFRQVCQSVKTLAVLCSVCLGVAGRVLMLAF